MIIKLSDYQPKPQKPQKELAGIPVTPVVKDGVTLFLVDSKKWLEQLQKGKVSNVIRFPLIR